MAAACFAMPTTEGFKAACKASPGLAARWEKHLSLAVNRWRPVPDNPDLGHEQTSFVRSKARVTIARGGNRSGKSEAAAYKTARHVLFTPPPGGRCPFWIVGETLEMAAGICWRKYLSKLIPPEMIAGIDWFRQLRGWPNAVKLKNGWELVFKAFAQGREALQADAVGGVWINEQPPMSIMEELAMRCVDYAAPMWADFTPLNMKHQHDWQDIEAALPPGWAVYRLNMLGNPYLPPGEADRVLAQVPADMRGTRAAGDYMNLQGMVYKDFIPARNVVKPFSIPDDWFRIRGVDFGRTNPFVCIWLARDKEGRWYAYDEWYKTHSVAAEQSAAIKARGWPDAPTWADHSGEGRAELEALGHVVKPAYKDSLWSGLEYVGGLWTPRPDGLPGLFVFNTCTNLIRELRNYRYPDAKPNRSSVELPMDVDDHGPDALRYAIYSQSIADRQSGKIEKLKKPERNGWRQTLFNGVGAGPYG